MLHDNFLVEFAGARIPSIGDQDAVDRRWNGRFVLDQDKKLLYVYSAEELIVYKGHIYIHSIFPKWINQIK